MFNTFLPDTNWVIGKKLKLHRYYKISEMNAQNYMKYCQDTTSTLWKNVLFLCKVRMTDKQSFYND